MIDCGPVSTGESVKIWFLFCCLSAAFAQESKAVPKRPPMKPVLRESFAKAGLRALIAIEDAEEENPIAGDAKKPFQEADAERDPDKPAEERMFSNLINFNLLRTVNNLEKGTGISDEAKDKLVAQERKCSSALETAFRHRMSIELPASCNPTK